jgi:hypothetical protein
LLDSLAAVLGVTASREAREPLTALGPFHEGYADLGAFDTAEGAGLVVAHAARPSAWSIIDRISS